MAYVLLSALFLHLLSPITATIAAAAESNALIRAPTTSTHPNNNQNNQLENHHHRLHPRFQPPVSIPDISKEYDLLDTVLVASIDGKFHALNRTSGQTLWSMSSFATTTSVSAPSSLAPLVRTVHAPIDVDLADDSDEDSDSETYIIEPQSGDIYVLKSPSSALQRFPFSMSQLVDISPFTSVGERDTKVFVGRKETSLLVIELETGRIKATLNAECPFVPEEYEDVVPGDEDELEGSARPPISAPTEVYIGRTDYHISILKKPQPGKPAPITQELIFSTYGPNNRDNHLQGMYRRTKDSTYIQSLPNGDVIAFRTANGSAEQQEGAGGAEGKAGALWGRPFPNTIVAIFDVLKPPHPSTSPPFVLLQPRPSLADLFPHASADQILPHQGSSSGQGGGVGTTAYIGMVEGAGTESLFVLSPERYPLVVFGGAGVQGAGRERSRGRIDGPKTSMGRAEEETEESGDVEGDGDAYTRPRYPNSNTHPHRPSSKDNENNENDSDQDSDLNTCLLRPSAPRCLVGVHALMPEGKGDAENTIGRWKRMIDAPKGGQQRMESDSGMTSGTGNRSGDSSASDGQQAEVIMPRPWSEEGDAGDHDNTSGSSNIPSSSPADGVDVGTTMIGYDTPRTWLPVPRIGDGSGSGVGRGLGGMGDWEVLSGVVMFLLGAWVVFGRVRTWLGARARGGGGVGVGKRDVDADVDVKDVNGKETKGEEENEAQIQNKDKELPNLPVPTALDPQQQEHREFVDVLQLARPSTPASVNSPTPTPSAANGNAMPTTDKEQDDGSVVIRRPSTPVPKSATIPTTPVMPVTPRPGAVNGNSNGSGNVENDDGEESEVDVAGATPGAGKKKSRRGKRGKKKKGGVVGVNGDAEVDKGLVEKEVEKGDKEKEKEEEKKPSSIVLTTSSPKPVVQQPSLYVSDTVLGFGSHGTVVFQGSLQGRAVAVKRLLQDFVTLAAREVSILQESDDHPNVIRYYYQESHANFLYIALELCPASLADIIEAPDREAWRDIAINFDPKRALRQIASGLRHLHALKLVHRDIKPQNILVGVAPGASASSSAATGKGKGYRMLISDFGLCKKLDVDQTSFLPTAYGAAGAGTVGWRAPEILRGEVKLDELNNGDESMSSRGSVATIHGSSTGSGNGSGSGAAGGRTRLTKSVDIFALGCLFYYTLTSGGHPYGDRFEREVNIMRDAKDLGALERFGEEGTEARDLIHGMLSPEARDRPDTTSILLHPFFWDAGRRLNFLQDASDRFEIMCREPKDPNLLALERGAHAVVGNDWHSRLDKIFIDNLGKFRKYDGRSVQDLMRALRNKKHHYQDLPDNVKRHLGPMPEGYLAYFTRRYPDLFLHVHGVVKDTGLSAESMFRTYFELPDI